MISAIILAAGRSKRMGEPKMLLPWGKLTVIEQVVTTFINAGTEEVVVVTGGAREQVETALEPYPVRSVHNPHYATEEMLASLQCGLKTLSDNAEAALVGLGDQPQVQESTIRLVSESYLEKKTGLVVPSFEMRRGHPWLVARRLWNELLALRSPSSPRSFLNQHAQEIHYVQVNTVSILADLDTPDDYKKSRP